MSIVTLLVVVIILAIVGWVWYNKIAPLLPPPLAFLRWLVPLIAFILIAWWLLSLVGILPPINLNAKVGELWYIRSLLLA